MKSPVAVESLLTGVFRSFGRKNPVVQTWRSNGRLFSEEAAAFLAGQICDEQKSVDEVLKSYYVGPLTKLRLIGSRCSGPIRVRDVCTAWNVVATTSGASAT